MDQLAKLGKGVNEKSSKHHCNEYQTAFRFISFHLALFIHKKTLQQIKYKTYLLIYNLRIKCDTPKKPKNPKFLICCCSRESCFNISLAS